MKGQNVCYWHLADIREHSSHVRFWGVKRTSNFLGRMSAYDPKRSLALRPTVASMGSAARLDQTRMHSIKVVLQCEIKI